MYVCMVSRRCDRSQPQSVTVTNVCDCNCAGRSLMHRVGRTYEMQGIGVACTTPVVPGVVGRPRVRDALSTYLNLFHCPPRVQ